LRTGNAHNLQTVDAADGIVCDSHHEVMGLDLPLARSARVQTQNLVERGIPDEM